MTPAIRGHHRPRIERRVERKTEWNSTSGATPYFKSIHRIRNLNEPEQPPKEVTNEEGIGKNKRPDPNPLDADLDLLHSLNRRGTYSLTVGPIHGSSRGRIV